MVKRLAMKDGDRARRLYKLGREVHDELEAAGAAVCMSDADTRTGEALSEPEM